MRRTRAAASAPRFCRLSCKLIRSVLPSAVLRAEANACGEVSGPFAEGKTHGTALSPPNSTQKPTSRRMPRPPAEPARSARDGRRHAACRTLNVNCLCIAASGAPPVRSRLYAACSLTFDPLGRPQSRSLTFPPPARVHSTCLDKSQRRRDERTPPHGGNIDCSPKAVCTSSRCLAEAAFVCTRVHRS